MDILEIEGIEDGSISFQVIPNTEGLFLAWGAEHCGDTKQLSKEDILQIVKFLIKYL